MLSHLRRPLFHFDFPEDGGGGIAAPDVEPAAEPFAISQDEWESFRDNSNALAQFVQSQQAAAQEQSASEQENAYRAALEDAFDQFSENFDPERGLRMMSELVDQRLAPLQQELAERQNQDQLDDAEDAVDEIFDELEVAAEQRDEVRSVANERLTGEALRIVLGRQGLEPEQVTRAAQSPDPVAQQWAAQVLQWADGEVGQLINGNSEAARIALEEARDIVLHGSESEAHYAAGGSVADAMFGGGPLRGGASVHDYKQGDSVSRRMFGGG